mgnify:CR=1 FL=1
MGTVVRTNVAIPGETGIIIAKSIAEGSPWNLKELITAHERQSTVVIIAEMDSSIELVNELHFKVTID